jgi:hypothetical protein
MLRFRTEHEEPPTIQLNAPLRDRVVELTRQELGPAEAAVGEWMVGRLLGTGVAMASPVWTHLLGWRRGKVADKTSFFAGDILLYQARGKKIRQFIHNDIKNLTPPIIVIGHSLGGVAVVDTLIKYPALIERVPLLVTVGSQAPFFYEITALTSLEVGQPLPYPFPDWLNIYDRHDFLSFTGGAVFPGRVEDQEVHSGQPFPESHSAYWYQDLTYDHITRKIEAL